MFYYSLPRLVDHPGQYFIGGDNIILVVEFSIFVKVFLKRQGTWIKGTKNPCLFWFSQLITFVLLTKEHLSSQYFSLIKLSKVEVLWEGHTILWNHQLRFDSEVNIKSKVEILQNLRASQNIWTLDIISYDLFCFSDLR